MSFLKFIIRSLYLPIFRELREVSLLPHIIFVRLNRDLSLVIVVIKCTLKYELQEPQKMK